MDRKWTELVRNRVQKRAFVKTVTDYSFVKRATT
jgi:hypothetical protein